MPKRSAASLDNRTRNAIARIARNSAEPGATGATGPAGPATTDASLLTSGTLPDGRFPATLPAISGANLTNLDAADLATGTVPLARITGLTNAEIAAAAAIDWTKVSKAGSSLADLITRSAGDLSSGTLADGRLSANVPLLNAANIFTANQRINAGLGVNVAPPATGAIAASAGLFDFGRSVAIGVGTSVAYNAADYTCDGGDTWTVDSGDVGTFSYWRVGEQLFVDLVLDNTSIAGGTAKILSVKIPASLTAVNAKQSPCIVFDNTGSAFEIGIARVLASSTTIDVLRAATAFFSVSINNTFIRAAMSLKVS
jgi:hypothetical protein